MKNVTIEESGMTFVFKQDDLFHIEKCATLSAMQGVKIIELIVKQSKRLIFIEAKNSSPQPGNKESFDTFITEIYEKFRNSLLLYTGLILGRPFSVKSQIPENHSADILRNARIHFYLIINGHKDEWLPPIDEELNLKLKAVKKCFAIETVKVINEKIAMEHNLISKEIK